MTSQTPAKVTARDFQTRYPIDWCPGCGDFGILSALQQTLGALQKPPHKVSIVGGIGCSGKTPYYVPSYSVTTLHGRVLPYATGIKLANPDMTVIAVGGDGDGMAIGAGHFVNSGRRNLDLTYILFNNEVYGLTKGQASPTLPLGLQTKSLPEPNFQGAVNPLMLALSSGFTWIGRAYAFDIRQQMELMQKAINHPGLSFLEILQPCPTYNDLHTRDWYGGTDLDTGPRVTALDPDEYDPVVPEDATDEERMERLQRFIVKAHQRGDAIPTGVFLENRSVTTFEERIMQRVRNYKECPPAHQVIADEQGRSVADLSSHFERLAVN